MTTTEAVATQQHTNANLRLIHRVKMGGWLIFLICLATVPIWSSLYILEVMTLILITTMFLYALDLVIGRTGLFSVAHGALYGIGAYTTGVLGVSYHWSFWATVPVAMAITAVLGFVIGVLTLHLSGHYFVIACLGFAIIMSQVLQDWTSVTNGTLGLSPVPKPSIFGLAAIKGPSAFYWLALSLTILVALVVWALMRSTTGMRLQAIRENVPLASALGIDTYWTRVVSMTISSAIAGFAGCFQAAFLVYIDPSVGGYLVGFEAGMALIVGGQASIVGPFIGALFLIGMPQVFGFTQSLDLVLFGSALIVVIIFAVDGIWGRLGAAARNALAWFGVTESRHPRAFRPAAPDAVSAQTRDGGL